MKNWIIFLISAFLLDAVCAKSQTVTDSVKVRLETSTGAEIGIDGDISSTNVLTKKVAVGKHLVTVKFGLTFVEEHELDVALEGEHTYVFPVSGKLKIESEPSSANIFVDGIMKGMTPAVIDLLGEHNIRVEKDTEVYHEYVERINVNPYDEVQRQVVLVKRPPKLYGIVMLNISPVSSSYGGFLGICRRFGAYTRFSMSRSSGFGKLSTSSNSYFNESMGTGLYKKDNGCYGSIAAGLMARCNRMLYAYVGAGYGEYAQKYSLDESFMHPSGAKNVIYPYGSKGCLLDLGAIFKWKALLFSCGYSVILGESNPNGKLHQDLYLGIGITIHNNRRK